LTTQFFFWNVRTAPFPTADLQQFLKVETQDHITLVEVELMGFAVLNKGVQLDCFAAMLDSPVMNTAKKILAKALRA
jgi:hypothetical protein